MTDAIKATDKRTFAVKAERTVIIPERKCSYGRPGVLVVDARKNGVIFEVDQGVLDANGDFVPQWHGRDEYTYDEIEKWPEWQALLARLEMPTKAKPEVIKEVEDVPTK